MSRLRRFLGLSKRRSASAESPRWIDARRRRRSRRAICRRCGEIGRHGTNHRFGERYGLFQTGHRILCPVHFSKREEKGKRGFRALILIYAVNMQSVSATARLSVVERNAQIVSTLKPFKSLGGLSQPVAIAGSLVSFHARANGRMCLDRLLVEGGRLLAALPKAIGTNRPKVSFRRELVLEKPTERFETDFKRSGCPAQRPVMIKASGRRALS